MKKFLSKVLTLALVCAIVVAGTSITSEAKGKKSSKAAKTTVTAYSSNPVVNDFVATMVKSSGLTINGKSYNSSQLEKLMYDFNSIVTTSPLYQVDDLITYLRLTAPASLCYPASELGTGGYVTRTPDGGVTSGYITKPDDPIEIYAIAETCHYMESLGGTTDFNFGINGQDDSLIVSPIGYYYGDLFAANGINAQYISYWMQKTGLTSVEGVYNYLLANGATFVLSDTHSENFEGFDGASTYVADVLTVETYRCEQCPNLVFINNSMKNIDGRSSDSYSWSLSYSYESDYITKKTDRGTIATTNYSYEYSISDDGHSGVSYWSHTTN